MALASPNGNLFMAGHSSWPSPLPYSPTTYSNCATPHATHLNNSSGRTNRKRVRHRPRRHRAMASSQMSGCNPLMARTAATMPIVSAAMLGGAIRTTSQTIFPEARDWIHAGNSTASYPMSHDAREARFATTTATALAASCIPSLPHETAASRERRIFGGTEDDEPYADGSESDEPKFETDLRGSMLDVVLRLFDGIDYDDDAMW